MLYATMLDVLNRPPPPHFNLNMNDVKSGVDRVFHTAL